MDSNRRSFLTAATSGLAIGVPLVLTPKRMSAQSGFPPFNTAAIDPTNLQNFQSTALSVANSTYGGGTPDQNG